MGFLRRVLGGRSAPAWAPFMTGAQYAAFVEVLDTELRGRGWRYELRDDGLFVDQGDGEPHAYGLTNLAQLCAAIERDRWAVAVREHFDHLGDIAGRRDPAEAWDEVRPLLKPRLFANDPAPTVHWISYPLAPMLRAVLAIDYPTTVAIPQREVADDWPVPIDELYAIALENLRAEPLPEPEVVRANEVDITVFTGDSFFVASHLLRLAELPVMTGIGHAIVAVPNRHLLVVRPVDDARAAAALGPIAVHAVGQHRAGPGSIVPDVFWWHGGALTPIPARLRDRGVEVHPPEAFLELLASLPAAPDAG